MLTVTHTSTYNVVRFADPYKRCREGGEWVDGVLDRPGSLFLVPCGHESDYDDACPSWGPVDGCRCAAILGSVNHPARS